MNVRIVLVETSHPGNIGATARAMKNMGLSDLVLVRPAVFPDAEATARASGADDVLARARVVDRLDEALADCVYTVAASARQRTIAWPEYEPREAAAALLQHAASGRVAAVFGREKSGLTNDELARAQALLTIPSVPSFASLNLAMAVQVVAYELRLAAREPRAAKAANDVPLATQAELAHYFVHLERVLTESGFLNPDNPRHLMRRLRRLYARALPDQNEINILRGILSSLWPAK
ncbi:MAG: RNA methyltransferase [Pseudomonadota bacterium]